MSPHGIDPDLAKLGLIELQSLQQLYAQIARDSYGDMAREYAERLRAVDARIAELRGLSS